MYLKIIGDPVEAQKKMGTKALLHKGLVLNGPESVFKELADNNPDLFSVVEEKQPESPLKPQKNKMIKPAKVA